MLTFNGIAEGKETIGDSYVKISDEPIDFDTVSSVVYSHMAIDEASEIVATFTKDIWSTQEILPGAFAMIINGKAFVVTVLDDITDDDMHLSKGTYVFFHQDYYVSLVSYTVEANVENKTLTFNGDATGMETALDGMYVKISDTYVDPRSIISATGVAGGTEVLTVPATEFLPFLADPFGDGSVFLLSYNGTPMIVLVSTKVDDGDGTVFNPGVYVINVPGEMYISEIQYYVELPPEYDWFRHLFLNEAKASLNARINTEAEELRKELDAAEEEFRKELETANNTITEQSTQITTLRNSLENLHNAYDAANNTIAELETTISQSGFALEYWNDKIQNAAAPYMFYYCSNLTSVPLFDTSNVTKMTSMFYHCTNLTSVPLFDTSNVTTMSSMFHFCISLTSVPLFDTSNVTDMSNMFTSCYKLTSVPLFDTSNVTTMMSLFAHCTSLTSVPLFDTSNVTGMRSMFQSCTNLTSVPLFDTSNVTTMTGMFSDCKNLTDCYLRNIKTNLQVGSGTSYGHLLTLDSLKHLIYELRDTGSLKTLTVGSANLEKLANIYVKTIDITDEMRAEDDLIDEKRPYVVCESTDEGAMLITNYVAEKHWTLK